MPFQKSTRTHCKRGHEYTPENTRTRLAPSGYITRTCKACNVITTREWVATNRPKPPRIELRAKRCKGSCGLVKTLEMFYRTTTNGHQARCKECHRIVAREWAQRHATPENKAKWAKRKRDAYAQNPESCKAAARDYYDRTKGKWARRVA